MVFLLGALCYTICTMKHFMALTEASSPGPGEEASWYSCLVLNMHYEGSSPGPSRAWGGAFMAFKLAKVLGNSHATHGSGLALINFM